MIRRRLRPSPAMVVAFIALCFAVGGGSWALAALPSRSVGAKQLKRGAVHSVNIASNAVTGAKIKRDSITGADIRENTLSGLAVSSAASASNATHANSSAALDKVTYVRQAGSVGPATGTDPNVVATIGAATATCPAGSLAVGGGVGIGDTSNTSVADSFPEPGGRGWTVRVDNSAGAAQAFTVVAVCLAAGAAG